MISDESVYAAICGATSGVFSTMLNLQPAPGQYYSQTDPPPLTGVMAILGFTGDWGGAGMLYCHEGTACRVSSIMLMNEITEVNNDVLDGVGEVANMVMGNIKDLLEAAVGPMAMSIPTVIHGRNFQARSLAHHDWVIVPFAFETDCFEVRICLAQKNNA